MIKRIFILSILIVFASYLVVAVTALNGKPKDVACTGMELSIEDDINYGFIDSVEIGKILKKKGLNPKGKRLGDINVRELETALSQNPFIREAECYITSGGKIGIDIYQRIPLMRIMSSNGDDYYIDHEGKIMSVLGKSVHVAIATGFIDRKFAQNKLYELGKFIQNDPFWKAQVEQINVTTKQEFEIVPRVGDHILFLGKGGDYQEKFRKLRIFYNEALNQVGWNKYERISIEFNNQIICTKKEK